MSNCKIYSRKVYGFLVLHLLQTTSIPSWACVTREFFYLLQNCPKIGENSSLVGVTRRFAHLLHFKTTK